MSAYEVERSLEEVSKLTRKEASAVRCVCESIVIHKMKADLELDKKNDRGVSERFVRLERALEGLYGQAIAAANRYLR